MGVSHGSARPIEFHPPRTQCFSDASFSSVAANLLSNRWRLCVRWLVAGVRWNHRSPKSGTGAVEISEFSGYGKGKVPATLVKPPLLEFVKWSWLGYTWGHSRMKWLGQYTGSIQLKLLSFFVCAGWPQRRNGPHLLRSQASGCAAGATGVPLSCCGREFFSRTRQLQDKQSNSQRFGSRMR